MKYVSTIAVLWLVLGTSNAEAYVGPGVGLSALGSILAFLGTVLLLLVGFVWYPLKRLLSRRRNRKDITRETSED